MRTNDMKKTNEHMGFIVFVYYHYYYSFNVRYFRAYAGQTFSP